MVDGEARLTADADAGGDPVAFSYLRDGGGNVVATWDEGRWWTPDESAAWVLMLKAPAAYVMAEGMREQTLPRWLRRRQKRRS